MKSKHCKVSNSSSSKPKEIPFLGSPLPYRDLDFLSPSFPPRLPEPLTDTAPPATAFAIKSLKIQHEKTEDKM